MLSWWDARSHQFVGDGAVGTVVLNPHLIADDVDVDDRTVNALDAVPADMEQFEMIALRIHDQFGFYLAIRRLATGVVREHLTNDLTVTVSTDPLHTPLFAFHRRMTKCRFNPETTNCPTLTSFSLSVRSFSS